MNVIHKLLADVEIPPMVHVRQEFSPKKIDDVEGAVRAAMNRQEILEKIAPGKEIAITCGSRKIDNIALIIRTIVTICKERGALPFIFPAMGSHAGAQAEGQKEICESYGVTEEYCGCEIRSSMETVCLGQTAQGLPAYIDKYAFASDGIIVVNRIKAHPSFSGNYESGLMKMMVIGMGKQVGAETCHKRGFDKFPQMLESLGNKILENAPILCGVGILEDAYDQTMAIHALTPEEIPQKEPELLLEAKANMPRLLAEHSDVLVVDWMGKDISGSGMDANITGRVAGHFKPMSNFNTTRLVALDLTEESHRSMGGVGNADIINKRIWEKGDITMTYPNSISHTGVKADSIPLMMDNDKLAVQCAIKTCTSPDPEHLEIIRIRDTLHLRDLMVSEALAERMANIPGVTILGEAEPWVFDENGNVIDCW